MEQAANTELHHDIASRRHELDELCVQFGVRKLELFGSAAHGGAAHDLDFLVDLGERPPAEYARIYFALRERLMELFARSVDLVTPPRLHNPYFRQRVEREKILLYAA
jgi:predicted nucleotidyltransferase